MKSKGDRERYIQLKAEFQRLAWRYKKAFFNEQCINPEGNNRRGKPELSSGNWKYQGDILLKDGHNKGQKW